MDTISLPPWIDCQLCHEPVPRATTTWRAGAGWATTHICCSCLVHYRTAIPDDPHPEDNYFAAYATTDDGWRDLLTSGEIPVLAVPITYEGR